LDNDFKNLYSQEYAALKSGAEPFCLPQEPSLVDATTLEILAHLGDIKNQHASVKVRYPFTTAQGPDNQTEGFKWFMNNDRNRQRQFLKPVDKTTKLEPLENN